MEERLTQEQLGSIDAKTLASVFRTSKKTIQEYIYEIETFWFDFRIIAVYF